MLLETDETVPFDYQPDDKTGRRMKEQPWKECMVFNEHGHGYDLTRVVLETVDERTNVEADNVLQVPPHDHDKVAHGPHSGPITGRTASYTTLDDPLCAEAEHSKHESPNSDSHYPEPEYIKVKVT